jgi:hypothetical protein
MTNDELLQRIDFNAVEGSWDIPVDSDRFNMLANNSRALRAIAELHQPTPEGRYPTLLCQGCSMTEVNEYVEYPCRTIRVIEKELS